MTRQVEFTADDVHTGCLLLVNATCPLRQGASTSKLEVLCAGAQVQGPVRLAAPAAGWMRRLLAACGGEDAIVPVSGYRSHEEQAALYKDTLAARGEAFTRQYVALPGCSEHETGLALDVGAAGEAGIDYVCPDFPAGEPCDSFRAMAASHGFILRYPEGKSDVTGIAHEPWHFRYVGRPHAAIMASHGWTLEEYIEELTRRGAPNTALEYSENGLGARLYTLQVPPGGRVVCGLPKGRWEAAGNNKNGVVVTLWQ